MRVSGGGGGGRNVRGGGRAGQGVSEGVPSGNVLLVGGKKREKDLFISL